MIPFFLLTFYFCSCAVDDDENDEPLYTNCEDHARIHDIDVGIYIAPDKKLKNCNVQVGEKCPNRVVKLYILSILKYSEL
jgi:hypothetical protein